MSLSLEFDDGQQAIHDALMQFCADHASDSVGRIPWSRSLWNELGELGILAPCTQAGEGGALEIAAALEALGAWACPGPFVATYFATQALARHDESSDESSVERIADGRWLVAMGEGNIFGFGGEADVWIELSETGASRGEPAGSPEIIECLGGDPSARLELVVEEKLAGVGDAHALAGIARAAQLSGCAAKLVSLASEHARNRKQFRKPIGDFQAVAHPLADAYMHVEAARSLARVAAFEFDHGDAAATATAAARARLSAAAAALETIHVVHQVFGAVGITLEGPIYHMTRRLRQWVNDPPSAGFAHDTVLQGIGWGSRDGA